MTVYKGFEYLGGKTGLFFRNKKYYLLLLPVLLLMGTLKADAFPWSYDMWIQPSILPYEEPVIYPALSVTTTGLRIKPLPREDFENITQSPIASTPESLDEGEKYYNRYCYVCHGMEGLGDGPVIKRGFYPLNLTTPGVIARTDGYIYAYIRYGGKVMMPSYRESITEDQAWDIVNYVRKLQGDPVKETAAEPPSDTEQSADTESPESENTQQESAE
ncbi:MAG: cytochrome c [Thermodesulfobacteriota bacterium]